MDLETAARLLFWFSQLIGFSGYDLLVCMFYDMKLKYDY